MDFDMQKNLTLPVLPLRGLVVFPKSLIHFDVGRKKSITAINKAMKADQLVFLTSQKDAAINEPDIFDVYDTGVIAKVVQVLKQPENTTRIVIEGQCRATIINPVFDEKCLVAEVKPYEEESEYLTARDSALMRTVKNEFDKYLEISPKMPSDIIFKVALCKRPGELADFITANLILDYRVKQSILETFPESERLESVLDVLVNENFVLKLEDEISQKAKMRIDENQRDYFLREQKRAIEEELGEDDSPIDDAENYVDKIEKLNLDEKSADILYKECKKLSKMPYGSQEAAVIRTYLDTVLDLPWNKSSKDKIVISKVQKALDKTHYGLDKVKKRIIEQLAVRVLSEKQKGQIICLAGPPGVGKTSIAQSIAKAIGRKSERIALGGVRDEAEIRGHRKTYIGAMPGSIIEAVIRTKTSNPLILLDEIDKLASDYKGDPSSALLEALDPEQNNTFRDHYIEIPFDLSKVLFVTTANDKNEIPAPLLDRMEVIELFSYTHEEKFNIAKKHLIPKQLKENGIKASQLHFTDNAIHSIIDGYTREAGVRTLERTFAKVMRKAAVKITEGYTGKISVKPTGLEAYLGPKKYKPESQGHKDEVGVVNGLAWTSVGGEMLKVEAVKMPGTGKLELTGSLGDVMKESARTAYSYIRSISEALPLDMDFYKNTDIHIHFPEGAVPKDGPSAGIAITTAVVSALTGIPVRADIAMTGEVTLTGNVLPIGGLKEKTMAAYRNGIKTVLIPEENVSDLKEIDDAVKENVDFISVSKADEVLSLALSKNVVVKDNKQRSIKLKQDRSQTASVCQQN